MAVIDTPARTRLGAMRSIDTLPGGPERRNVDLFGPLMWVLVALTVGLTVYPLGRLLISAFSDEEGLFGSISFVLSRPWLGGVLLDTIILVAISGVVAMTIASIFAWISERTDASLGWFGDVLPLVPLLLPQITFVIGWVLLASPAIGFITQPLMFMGFEPELYSWPGMIVLYSMSLVPFAYLIISVALRNIDPAIEEAARINGASLSQTVRKVSLPAILPSLGSATLLVMIQGLSFYAVPSIIGPNADIDVLSVRIVSVVRAYPPDIATSSVLSLFLASMIIPLWLIQRSLASRNRSATLGGRGAGSGRIPLGRWRWVARGTIFLYLGVFSVLPFLALLIVSLQPYWNPQVEFSVLSFDNFQNVLFENLLTQGAILNSVQIGMISGLSCMFIAFVIALFVRTRNPRIGVFVDGISKVPILMPHVAFGLAFLIALGGPPFNLAGTIAILIIANTVMFLPQAAINAESALSQVGKDLEEAALVNGASGGVVARKIIFPLMLPGLVAGWSLIFVLAAAELAAAQLLSTGATPVIGAVIYDIYSGGTFGPLAALSVMITIISATVIAIAAALTRLITNKRK